MALVAHHSPLHSKWKVALTASFHLFVFPRLKGKILTHWLTTSFHMNKDAGKIAGFYIKV